MSLSVGTNLGPYEILGPLGAGGMGEVYKARDTRLDRIVALKVSKSEFSERFEREARAVAALNHSNICTLYDVGPNYLVMEYIEGAPLKGPLPVDQALKYAVQICHALDAAHKKGITHRDLKPANILVTKTGIKLLDFGLAKLSSAGQTANLPSDATLTMALTGKNEIVGTLYYMSPEQLQSQGHGQEIDARSDIFAFGLVLYEMLTGQRAFEGASPASVIAAIMERPAPSIASVAPPALDRSLQRCLAKDPDDRWQTARDLGRELEWIAAGGSQPAAAAPAAPTRRLPLAWALAGIALVSTAALSWAHFRERPDRLPVGRFSVSLPSNQILVAGPVVSPDGARALFWLGPSIGSYRIYVYTLETGEYQPIAGTEGTTAAAWSPDNRFVAVLNGSTGELRRIDLAGGTSSVLAKTKPAAFCGTPGYRVCSAESVSWGSRGAILFAADGGLHRISAEGGAPQNTGVPNGGFQFLPDGEHFLHAAPDGEGVKTRVLSLQGGSPVPVLEADTGARYVHGDYLLFVRNNSLQAQSFDSTRFKLLGSPITITSSMSAGGFRSFSTSDNGVLMYHAGASSGGDRLTWLDRRGRKLGTVGPVDEYGGVALSPDGKRLAANVGSDVTKKRDIWIYDLVRGGSYRLTFDPGDDFSPVWTTDGQSIIFGSDRKGRRDIYRKLASGTGEEELLYESTNENKAPESLTADGRYLWVSVQNQQNDIYMFSMTERKLQKYIATPFQENKAYPSPNGRWLAYRGNESGRDEVYLQPFPATGERWQVSTTGGDDPQWSGDSKELFFLARKTMMAATIKPVGKSLEIGIPKALFDMNLSPGNTRNHFVPASDGQKFLVILQEEQTPGTRIEVVMNWTGMWKPK